MNEYERFFIEQSNLLAGKGDEITNEDMIAWGHLKEQSHLTEINVIDTWKILEDCYEDTTGLRRSTKEGECKWELLDFFLAGWTLYAEDHSTSPLKALHFYRIFLLANPFRDGSARIGRMLFLWMLQKNKSEKKYYFNGRANSAHEQLLTDGSAVSYKDVKSLFKRYIKK